MQSELCGKVLVAVLTALLALVSVSFGVAAETPASASAALPSTEPRSDPPVAMPEVTAVPWQQALVEDPDSRGFRDLASWRGGFVAIGWPSRPEGAPRDVVPVWLSPDGAQWTPTSAGIGLPSRQADVSRVIAFEARLYAFGSVGRRLLVWRSKDGLDWHQLEHRATFATRGLPEGYSFSATGAVSGHGKLVVNGWNHTDGGDTMSYPRAWVTTDGRHWRSADDVWAPLDMSVAPSGFQSAAWGARPIPRDCHDDAHVVTWSRNGLRWREVKGARPTCGLGSVAWDPASERYYGTALTTDPYDDSQRMTLLRSHDRRTWRELLVLVSADLEGGWWDPGGGIVHVDDGHIVVVGESHQYDGQGGFDRPWTMASTDGQSWRVTMTPPELEIGIDASVLDHGRLVLSGYHGTWWADVDDLLPEQPA